MIKKNIFNNTLKGFDEAYLFAAMEDVDLHYRLKKLNERILFLSKARVIHPWRVQNKPFNIGRKRFSALVYFLRKFPEKQKDYNAFYFLRAFLFAGIGILKNSIRFRFRGFSNRVVFAFLQLYFALRISIENYK
jgi:GT2 family glycosyltransferase